MFFHAGFAGFSGGFVGVDVFFVISGYLITSIISGEKEQGKFSLVDFYERRARRILPSLFFVLLVCLPLAWLWLSPQDLKEFFRSLAATSTFSSNIFFWKTSGYFDTSVDLKPLLHTWSLAVEEQYYVLFPLMLMAMWKWGSHWMLTLLACVALGSFAWAQRNSVLHPEAAFYLLPSRGWELLMGAFVAFYLRSRESLDQKKWLSEVGGAAGLLMLAGAIVFFNEATPFPGVYALVPTVGACLIILFASPRTAVGALLGQKAIVGMGLVSYGAYLWHQPLYAFARQRSLNEPGALVFAGLVVASIVLGAFNWKYIEAPFRSRTKFSRRQVFAFALIGSAMFIALGTWGRKQQGFPERLAPSTQAFASANMEVFEREVKDCWNRFEQQPDIEAACALGKTGRPVSFALFGDSHAGALLHELDSQTRQAGMSGLNYTYRSCPPLMALSLNHPTQADQNCMRLRSSFFAALRDKSSVPQTVIVNARWALLMEAERFDNGEGGNESGTDWHWELDPKTGDYQSAMRASIIESVRAILNSGRKVVLVYPVPEMGWSVPERLMKLSMVNGRVGDADASTSYERFLQRNKRAIEALDAIGESPQLVRIRPSDFLCNRALRGRCAAQAGGEPLYFDGNHLSAAGARPIVGEIKRQLVH